MSVPTATGPGIGGTAGPSVIIGREDVSLGGAAASGVERYIGCAYGEGTCCGKGGQHHVIDRGPAGVQGHRDSGEAGAVGEALVCHSLQPGRPGRPEPHCGRTGGLVLNVDNELHCHGLGKGGAQGDTSRCQREETGSVGLDLSGGREAGAYSNSSMRQRHQARAQAQVLRAEEGDVNVPQQRLEEGQYILVAGEGRVPWPDKQPPLGDTRVGEGLRDGERCEGPRPNVAEEDAARFPRQHALDRLGRGEGRRTGPDGEF